MENIYICPMHPEVVQNKPGICPKCHMNLIIKGSKMSHGSQRKFSDFLPLVIIFAVILGLTALLMSVQGKTDALSAMRIFEGFFFVVFGGFKLLNWKGFVEAYSTYDIVAKRSTAYAYAYPLIELALGLGYLFSFYPLVIAWITLILMVVSSIGVAKELKKKRQIPCACLGVVFKIPMTWVTFIEDVLMAVMALVMILMPSL